MTFNVSSLSPAACGAYVDALATPAVSRLLGTTSSFAYSDNQLACLIAGAVALALLLGVYCCGYARHCFHHFDYFSTDFWIDAGDADAEDEDGADHLQPFEYGGGVTSKKSLRAVPRLKKLGGVAVWAGIALGAALCGDLLSWVSADEGYVLEAACLLRRPSYTPQYSITLPPPPFSLLKTRQCRPNWRVACVAPVRICRCNCVVDVDFAHRPPAPAADC